MDYVGSATRVLKERGFRMTRPRQLVLETLDAAPLPLTAYEIANLIKASGETGDVVGVYRTLDTLEQQQLVHRLLATGKYAKCQLGPEDDCQRHQLEHCHHNLVCRACGRIEEVHCPGVGLLMQAIAAQSDFQIEAHALEFTGLCGACKA